MIGKWLKTTGISLQNGKGTSNSSPNGILFGVGCKTSFRRMGSVLTNKEVTSEVVGEVSSVNVLPDCVVVQWYRAVEAKKKSMVAQSLARCFCRALNFWMMSKRRFSSVMNGCLSATSWGPHLNIRCEFVCDAVSTGSLLIAGSVSSWTVETDGGVFLLITNHLYCSPSDRHAGGFGGLNKLMIGYYNSIPWTKLGAGSIGGIGNSTSQMPTFMAVNWLK